MRRFAIAVVSAAAFLAASPLVAGSVAAGPGLTPDAFGAAADSFDAVVNGSYVWRGRRYCWYDHGWKGAGWYWCGYAQRPGHGWGGGAGWHSWRPPHKPRPPIHKPPHYRPPHHKPPHHKPPQHKPPGHKPPFGGKPPHGGKPPGTTKPAP